MSEFSESKRIKAKQHKNSGRNTKKGDASWNNFTIDFKEVEKSFTLNKDVWAKVTTDAIKNKSEPLLIVTIKSNNKKIRLAVLSLEMLELLTSGKMV